MNTYKTAITAQKELIVALARKSLTASSANALIFGATKFLEHIESFGPFGYPNMVNEIGSTGQRAYVCTNNSTWDRAAIAESILVDARIS